MARRTSFVVIVACVLCAVQAAAQSEERVPITDPQELAALGFEPGATKVFRLVRQQPAGVVEGQGVQGFGLTLVDHTALDSKAFHGRTSAFSTGQGANYQGIYCTNATTELFADAQLEIPTGSMLNYLRWWIYDSDAADDMQIILLRYCLPEFAAGTMTSTTLLSTPAATGAPGLSSNSAYVGETVDNPACVYRVRVRFATGSACKGSSLELGKVRAEWVRQIHAAPASASFTDVPTSYWAFQGIEALKASGITTGCNPPTNDQFCPEMTVTRAQMAMFLSRALGLAWYWNNF